ncbi:MAG: MotA/TolQ/ExbB proton channel family protein [Magnetococcales bacterium]|nr:MotA/TolQ/ExbB proton channel family protein [Magnetococcales bacterium]
MDIASLIGLGIAFSVVGFLMGGNIALFWSSHAFIVVFGGLLGATFLKFNMKDLANTAGIIGKVFKAHHERPQDIIAQITDMANIARKDGMLALEKVKTSNLFLQTAINHCVDGMDPDTLETVLYKDMAYMEERHHVGVIMFDSMGEAAPAMGMVGTLIGMVEMLANIGGDMGAVGHAMAVALLATCYGAIVANMITIPIGIKLHHYSKEEQIIRMLIIDGIKGIQKGVNPRVLETMLLSALSPKERETV